MKTKITLVMAAILYAVSIFSQVADSTFIKKWDFSHYSFNGIRPTNYLTLTQDFIDTQTRGIALADSVVNFDPANANFDATWSSISGDGYPLTHNNGLAASDHGPADFTGSFKVLYDDLNMYILIKWTDDDNLGTESVEVMWAQDLKIDGSKNIYIYPATGTQRIYAQYGRYVPFGAYKATFTKTGFSAAMMVNSKADPAYVGHIIGDLNWGGTNALLTNNLFQDDKSTSGSNTVKRIITIGYPALTGEQRPEFNPAIWRKLNAGKGISFDIKVNDIDTDDSYNTAATPVQKPAEYWWNSTDNIGYAMTYYCGFLGLKTISAVQTVNANSNTIFGKRTADLIELNEMADVTVFNLVGKQVLTQNKISRIDLAKLTKGIYLVQANNQTLKVVR